jgi:glycosyltransferase involved in cell wall biosynthesis
MSDSPRVLLAHPTGNQFFRQLASALHRSGRLAEAATSIDWPADGWIARCLPGSWARELERRSFAAALGFPVVAHGPREWGRVLASRLGWTGLLRHESGVFSIDTVNREFDAWVARRLLRRRHATAVYAYEDAALATFTAARQLGLPRYYDLPIAYWETSHRLLAEEADRWPEWESTLESTRNSPAKLARKTRELELADIVICPSEFVAASLPPDPRGTRRVVVAPFGSPEPQVRAQREPRPGAKLRVLFAGSMSQRKGLADLFAAVRGLRRPDVELVVMGSPVAGPAFYRRVGPEFTHEPPRPHAAVLALMRSCDVLCLPSIVEGRALVVQEAMSQGLPVIVTPNTGTTDVVEDGVNGFVVPIRSPERLAARLTWCADHRPELAAMGAVAARRAALFSWASYASLIGAALAASPQQP